MIEFDSCCFCIPLRVGCLILGYLSLVGNIIVTVTSIAGISVGAAMAASDDKKNADIGVMLAAIYGVVLVFVLILLTFTIVLLVGLHKEKRGHVKVYLIYALVFLAIYVILFIVKISLSPVDVGYIIGTIIQFLLSVYFLLVIRSHYVKMGERKIQGV